MARDMIGNVAEKYYEECGWYAAALGDACLYEKSVWGGRVPGYVKGPYTFVCFLYFFNLFLKCDNYY